MKKNSLQLNTQSSNPVFSDEDLSTTPNLLNYISFSAKDLLYWWYIQMPIFYIKKIERISIVTSDQLSIIILIQNFFIPWKRHKAVVGYFIGITTKILYLPLAISMYLLTLITCLSFLITWLLIPLAATFFTLISLFLK